MDKKFCVILFVVFLVITMIMNIVVYEISMKYSDVATKKIEYIRALSKVDTVNIIITNQEQNTSFNKKTLFLDYDIFNHKGILLFIYIIYFIILLIGLIVVIILSKNKLQNNNKHMLQSKDHSDITKAIKNFDFINVKIDKNS